MDDRPHGLNKFYRYDTMLRRFSTAKGEDNLFYSANGGR